MVAYLKPHGTERVVGCQSPSPEGWVGSAGNWANESVQFGGHVSLFESSGEETVLSW